MRFVVRGRVQGVNFRMAAAREARGLGLSGRVWNRDDGAVEAIAEGDDAAVDRFAAWLAHGPSLACVEGVDAEPLAGGPAHHGFGVG